jgi:hypothetical protein
VGERLVAITRRSEREPGRSGAQLRALELLAAACVAEAARTAAEAPRFDRQAPPQSLLPAPDPGFRGAWVPPERGTS